MGLVPRILASLLILGVAAPSAAWAFDGPTQVQSGAKNPTQSSKKGKDGAASSQNSASKGKKSLDAGKKAYQAGDAKRAVKLINTAMASKELSSQEIAQALYYRGLAYKKAGVPGRAISDLSGAIWMKGGLTSSERAQATKVRDAAYRAAGINNPPGTSQSKLAVASPASNAAADAFSGWETATKDIGVPDSPKPTTTAAASPTPAPSASQTSAPTSTSSTSSSGGGIGGFFSNVTNFFSGGSSSDQPAPQSPTPVTTASTKSPPVESSSWTQSTQVSAAPSAAAPKPPPQVTTPFKTQVAVAPSGTNAAERTATGKYRVQVASVRSRSEANAVAAQVIAKYGSQLGSRRPVIDEAVVGSMGTFYRVRLGPYASANEPEKLCGSLRSSGFDCLVVTQ